MKLLLLAMLLVACGGTIDPEPGPEPTPIVVPAEDMGRVEAAAESSVEADASAPDAPVYTECNIIGTHPMGVHACTEQGTDCSQCPAACSWDGYGGVCQ